MLLNTLKTPLNNPIFNSKFVAQTLNTKILFLLCKGLRTTSFIHLCKYSFDSLFFKLPSVVLFAVYGALMYKAVI